MDRRSFSRLLASSALVASAWDHRDAVAQPISSPPAQGSASLRVAVIADTHIIDPYYKGPEDNDEDTRSMAYTNARLLQARDSIRALRPAVDCVFHLGDIVHDFPSGDEAFYFAHETRLDIAKRSLDGFRLPVHLCLGNHDYGLPRLSRETTHRLFHAKFGMEPYRSIETNGWRFLLLNNFLGESWRLGSPAYDQGVGTLGETQLQWLEAELRKSGPTIVMTHYPLWQIQEHEIADYGLLPLLRRYQDNIPLVLAGHWHKWVDFAHTFGPRHLVCAATRYDPNSLMVLDLDAASGHWSFVNQNCVEWATHFSHCIAAKS